MNILTIAGHDTTIVGYGKATITLPMGTQITIEKTLLYPDSTHTLLIYRDICHNGLHVITHENKNEFLLITKSNGDDHDILERIPSLKSGLYYTYIKLVPYVAYKVIFQDVDAFQTCHDRIGHPGLGMMKKIIDKCIGHNLREDKFPKHSDFMCTTCATGKLILRLSPLKIQTEPLKFLERIQCDICGPIQPLCGPFRYFMVLIDTSTQWSHVCLLSTRNHAFAKFMTQVIRLKENFSEHRMQSIRLDNVVEFSSRAFNDYCKAQEIQMQHVVPYVHTQNGLSESLIKWIKLIARPLLHNCNFSYYLLGSCVLTR
jgi:hypothetical protein